MLDTFVVIALTLTCNSIVTIVQFLFKLIFKQTNLCIIGTVDLTWLAITIEYCIIIFINTTCVCNVVVEFLSNLIFT